MNYIPIWSFATFSALTHHNKYFIAIKFSSIQSIHNHETLLPPKSSRPLRIPPRIHRHPHLHRTQQVSTPVGPRPRCLQPQKHHWVYHQPGRNPQQNGVGVVSHQEVGRKQKRELPSERLLEHSAISPGEARGKEWRVFVVEQVLAQQLLFQVWQNRRSERNHPRRTQTQ